MFRFLLYFDERRIMPEGSWFRRAWNNVDSKVTEDYPEADEPYDMRSFFKQRQNHIRRELLELRRPGMRINSTAFDQAAYYFARSVQGRPIPEEAFPMLNDAAETLSKVEAAMHRGRSNIQEDINKAELSISRLMYAGREGFKYLRQHPVYGRSGDGIPQLAFITELTATGNCDEHATRTAMEHLKSSKIPGETVLVEDPIDHAFIAKKTPVGTVIIDKWTVGGAPLSEDSNFYQNNGASLLETKIEASHVEMYDALCSDKKVKRDVGEIVWREFSELNKKHSMLHAKHLYEEPASVYSKEFIINTEINFRKQFFNKTDYISNIHAVSALLKQGATVRQAQNNAENVMEAARNIFNRHPGEWRQYASRQQPASSTVEEIPARPPVTQPASEEPTPGPQANRAAPGVASVQFHSPRSPSILQSGTSYERATRSETVQNTMPAPSGGQRRVRFKTGLVLPEPATSPTATPSTGPVVHTAAVQQPMPSSVSFLQPIGQEPSLVVPPSPKPAVAVAMPMVSSAELIPGDTPTTTQIDSRDLSYTFLRDLQNGGSRTNATPLSLQSWPQPAQAGQILLRQSNAPVVSANESERLSQSSSLSSGMPPQGTSQSPSIVISGDPGYRGMEHTASLPNDGKQIRR
ncbi:hypothetical protein [Cupriavidus necator]